MSNRPNEEKWKLAEAISSKIPSEEPKKGFNLKKCFATTDRRDAIALKALLSAVRMRMKGRTLRKWSNWEKRFFHAAIEAGFNQEMIDKVNEEESTRAFISSSFSR